MILFDSDSIAALLMVLFLISFLSYFSKGVGLACAFIFSAVELFVAFALAVGGGGKYAFQMAVIFPLTTWVAFWFGRKISNRSVNRY